MNRIVQFLRRSGVLFTDDDSEDESKFDLHEFLRRDDCDVETDDDGSQRVRLGQRHDQLVRTGRREWVLVSDSLASDEFDAEERTVCARSTTKAAGELTRLRLWRAIEAALAEVDAIGKPEKPATLDAWCQENDEHRERLQQSVDAIALAAEKTHQFSAQIFEPALLEEFYKRTKIFKKAIALYFVAEAMRGHIVAETRRRLVEKIRTDPEERQNYHQRKEKLYLRAAKLYDRARELFSSVNAVYLVRNCQDRAEGCRDNATEVSAADAVRARSVPLLKPTLGNSERDETRRLIDAEDVTLQKTVRMINGLQDVAQQKNLERRFASHLVRTARLLRTPEEVAALLAKVRDLRQAVSATTFIGPSHLAQYELLISRERPDVLPPRQPD
jgi:hypothetical protein